jgi:RNA polymerase sigma-70 factor (ECF subfamily)
MPETEPNQILLKAIKNGNQFAFRRFFDRYKSKVFHFAFKFLTDEELSKEVVQLVFVKFWENRSKIEIHSSIDTFLYVLAKNTCLDLLRKIARDRKLADHFINNHQEQAFYSENTVLYNELFTLTEDVIDQLPAKQKRVYQMAKWEKMSYDEIAEAMQISRNTVKTQLKLANAFVKKNLTKAYGKAISLLVGLIMMCI